MAFKKPFLFVTLILAAVLIQPAFSMDDAPPEKGCIRNLLSTGYKTLGEMADLIDKIHDGEGPPPLTIRPSTTPFFEALSDEVALKLLSRLGEINDLRSVALTCKGGYELTQDKSFWELIEKTYFGHLPHEYVETLIEGREEQPFPLARILLQQLLTYQADEIKRLKEMLSPWQTSIEEQEVLSLIRKINPDVKANLLNKLKNEENLNSKRKFFELYLSQEETLDSINSKIIEECLNFVAKYIKQKTINGVVIDYNMALINLRCALTRLPREGVESIKEKSLFLCHTDDIGLFLSHNQLRWIPDELFSIEKLKYLNVMNNLLGYIPKTIERAKDHFRILLLGNYERSYALSVDSCRTFGNKFRKIPPAILKLSNLYELGINSVNLEKFPDDKIYGALPNLVYLNVSHNNLPIIPKSIFNSRNIAVFSIDNPGSPHALTLLDKVGLYNGAFIKKCILKPGNFFLRNPFVALPAIIIFAYSTFFGAMYLEHGSDVFSIFRKG